MFSLLKNGRQVQEDTNLKHSTYRQQTRILHEYQNIPFHFLYAIVLGKS